MSSVEREGQNVTGKPRDINGAVVANRFVDALRPRLRWCKDGEDYCMMVGK